MKKHSLRFLILILTGVLLYSCEKDFETDEISQTQLETPNNITKLGVKLENPFSVDNMQRALDTILKSTEKSESYHSKSYRKTTEEIEIIKTDLYVRFLLKDSLELDLIKRDTTLVFYNYPVDYEIEEQGEYYQDPELADEQITWQYTVVKPGYDFPDITHEILSNFIYT
jgi:hypothetical protein